ncbi:E3 ubiquitin-protein ligase TRIM9, partial [Biomphalaria pfeifferi]
TLSEIGYSNSQEPESSTINTLARFTFDTSATHQDVVVSNGKMTITCSTFDHRIAIATVGFSKGVHYWELTFDRYDNDTDPSVGVCRFDVDRSSMLG